MAELVEGSRLKLRRAKAHLKRFHASIERFREQDPYRLTRREEREGDDILWTWDVEMVKPMRDNWSILTGEIAYNIHSALDHLAFNLATLESAPKEPENVTFPIFCGRGDFRKKAADGTPRKSSGEWAIARLPSGAGTLVEAVQPYKCGNRAPEHPLWHLYVLSNEDKHKALHLLHAAATGSRIERVHVQDMEVGQLHIVRKAFDGRGEGIGSVRARITGPKPEVHLEPAFRFEEVFGGGSPAPLVGQPVWDTLKRIYNYVAEDVFRDRFDPFLEGL